jgi:hypothetical protein
VLHERTGAERGCSQLSPTGSHNDWVKLRRAISVERPALEPAAEADFPTAWSATGCRPRCSQVYWWAGGLATVMASTARVESDFSRLRLAKASRRAWFRCISLEGPLQAQQLPRVAKVTGPGTRVPPLSPRVLNGHLHRMQLQRATQNSLERQACFQPELAAAGIPRRTRCNQQRVVTFNNCCNSTVPQWSQSLSVRHVESPTTA